MSQHAKYLIALAVEAVIVAGIIAVIVGVVVTRRCERQQQAAFRADQRARRRAAEQATAPVEHVGATEDWSPAAETAAAAQTPDLRTTGEQMVADHAELASISDGLDRFSENVMHELRLFLRDDTEYAKVARWAPSSVTDTGTLPVVRAELAGAVA